MRRKLQAKKYPIPNGPFFDAVKRQRAAVPFRAAFRTVPGEQVEVADREVQQGPAAVVEEDEGGGKDRRSLRCEI